MRVSDDYKMAAKLCLEKLDRISDTFVFSKENTEPLIQTAMTTLGSKIVHKCHRQFAKMAVGAIISVANVDQKYVDFELNTVYDKKKDKADDKKAVRKSSLQRAALKITITKSRSRSINEKVYFSFKCLKY